MSGSLQAQTNTASGREVKNLTRFLRYLRSVERRARGHLLRALKGRFSSFLAGLSYVSRWNKTVLGRRKAIGQRSRKDPAKTDASKPKRESFGAYLKREREYRDITLKEISRTTKVQESILRALEEDQVDSLPSIVFVKGFLRAYASYVGLNPTDIVLRYETFLRGEDDAAGERVGYHTLKQWGLKSIVFPLSLLLIMGIVLLIALPRHRATETSTVLQQIVEPVASPPSEAEIDPPTVREEVKSVLPSHDIREELPVSPLPVPPPRTAPPSPPQTPSGIDLQLRASEDTWIQIQIDHGPPKAMLLRSGENISRRGEESMEMKIGNAGGVQVLHNGKDLGKPGESGKVIYLSITPEGVKIRRSRGSPPRESAQKPAAETGDQTPL